MQVGCTKSEESQSASTLALMVGAKGRWAPGSAFGWNASLRSFSPLQHPQATPTTPTTTLKLRLVRRTIHTHDIKDRVWAQRRRNMQCGVWAVRPTESVSVQYIHGSNWASVTSDSERPCQLVLQHSKCCELRRNLCCACVTFSESNMAYVCLLSAPCVHSL